MQQQQLECYNPYILHLLYVKMRYLRRLVLRYYRRYSEENEATRVMDYCILNDWYAALLTRELSTMLGLMIEERSPMALSLCHYEYYLFRISQMARLSCDPIDALYGGRRYQCESKALCVIKEDYHKLQLQQILRHYVEHVYFSLEAAKTKRRVELLFHVKHTLEKEIQESVIDKEGMQFFIQYDNELIATLFYIHLIEELISLEERQLTRITHESVIDVFVFERRKLYVRGAQVHPIAKDERMGSLLLRQLMITLCQTFREQLPERVKYYANSSQESSNSWFSSSTTTATTTTQSKQSKYASLLNQKYTLEAPVDETVTVLKSSRRTLGRSDFYEKNESKGAPMVLLVIYIGFIENTLHYTHFLYRVAFELYLRENHSCSLTSVNKACYLCEYYTRGDTNRKLATLFRVCEEQIEDPETLSGRLVSVNEELGRLYIERMPPITLCSYKTLANIFCLFETQPLKLKDQERTHCLLEMINPVEMLEVLSKTVILNKLERQMVHVLTHCHRKLGFVSMDDEIVEREQALAMDIELVRLINDAILVQQNEIRRYERSITHSITLESTELTLEMSRVLRSLYVAHIDVLCQLIVERHDSVKFDT